jgi:hypothetical protein
MHFGTKSYLKSNRNHTAKQTLLSEQYSDGGVIPNKNPVASYELLLDSLSA